MAALAAGGNGASLSQATVEASGRKLLDSSKAVANSSTGSVPVYTCMPALNEKEVMDMFLCGTKAPTQDQGVSRAVGAYCKNSFSTPEAGRGGKIVWDCLDGYDQCLKMGPRFLSDVNLVTSEGFVVQVNKLLRDAAERVRTDQPVYSGENGQQVLNLIQSTPYPIYQVINSAAVYPAAANELLDTMSLLVAENMAYAYFDQFMRLSMTEQFSLNGTLLSRDEVDRIQRALESFRALNVENRKLIAQNYQVQEAIAANIRTINAAVQRQVLTTDMLYQNKLAGSISQNPTSLVQGNAPAGNANP
jgi:hypothetical protein